MTKKVKSIDVPTNGTNAPKTVKAPKAITPAKKAPAKGPKVITVTPAELVESAAPVMSALQAQSANMSEGFTHVANMLNDADDAINGLGSRVDRHDVAIEKAIAELATHAEGLDVLTRVVLAMQAQLAGMGNAAPSLPMAPISMNEDDDDDDNAISPATIERSANIILAETVSHVRENMAKGTAGYNKKIIPQIGVVKDGEGNVLSHTDYRVYLTTPQHRTFKVAFGVGKKLGNRMTLSQAAQMLYDAV